MFCPSCGKKLSDKAKFCDGCGAKLEDYSADAAPVKEEKRTTLCPYCGTPIGFDDVRCPGCRMEIQKGTSSSLNKFFDEVNKIEDEAKKIELIKTFPIPNTREDIIEFMLLASTNFDAKYYISHKDVENVSGAWLVKIDQCYKKGLLMFDDPRDTAKIEKIYNDVHGQLKETSKKKLYLLIIGIAVTVLGGIGMVVTACLEALKESPARTPLFAVAICVLIVGIILITISRRKKKTKQEIIEEKEEKERHRTK